MGEGTSFFLYFPITRDTAETVSSSRIAGGSERILVVDDDQLQRSVARTLLESLGYTVIDASSGEGALEVLSQQSCDLMIVDMIMPGGIDGAETCRRAFMLDSSFCCPGTPRVAGCRRRCASAQAHLSASL
jgi:PleD family two-component response regulator